MVLQKFKVMLVLIAGFAFSNCGAQENSCEVVFTNIYDHEVWGAYGKGSSSSGIGSWPEFALPYMEFLEDFIAENQVQSVLDIGCGDWAFSSSIDWNGKQYIGVDVVRQVIERNIRQFSSANINFVHGDILRMDFPPADLLVCKDVLQHLTNAEIEIFLSKIKGFRHCLITNDSVVGNEIVVHRNRDIPEHGPNRPLDLTKPPFNVKGIKIFRYPVTNHVKEVLYIRNQE